jgi:hypothetical protein
MEVTSSIFGSDGNDEQAASASAPASTSSAGRSLTGSCIKIFRVTLVSAVIVIRRFPF